MFRWENNRILDRRLIIFLKDVCSRYAIQNSITKVVELLESDWKYKILQRNMSINFHTGKQHYWKQKSHSSLSQASMKETLEIMTSTPMVSSCVSNCNVTAVHTTHYTYTAPPPKKNQRNVWGDLWKTVKSCVLPVCRILVGGKSKVLDTAMPHSLNCNSTLSLKTKRPQGIHFIKKKAFRRRCKVRHFKKSYFLKI